MVIFLLFLYLCQITAHSTQSYLHSSDFKKKSLAAGDKGKKSDAEDDGSDPESGDSDGECRTATSCLLLPL